MWVGSGEGLCGRVRGRSWGRLWKHCRRRGGTLTVLAARQIGAHPVPPSAPPHPPQPSRRGMEYGGARRCTRPASARESRNERRGRSTPFDLIRRSGVGHPELRPEHLLKTAFVIANRLWLAQASAHNLGRPLELTEEEGGARGRPHDERLGRWESPRGREACQHEHGRGAHPLPSSAQGPASPVVSTCPYAQQSCFSQAQEGKARGSRRI